jgi:molecular chaperone DnaK
MEGGQPKVIENSKARARRLVVAYTEDGEILVGNSGEAASGYNAKNTIFAVKRLIGRKFEEGRKFRRTRPDAVQDVRPTMATPGSKFAARRSPAAGFLKSAQDENRRGLSRRGFRRHLVPAYFNDSRAEHQDAGKTPPDVKRIINEPTAAVPRSAKQKAIPSPRCTTWVAY